MKSYMAAVIGAGPAGTTAARLLAEAGISVILLEKAQMPRVKPCGGALTHRALGLLPAGYETYLKSHPTDWTFQGRHGQAVTVSRLTPYCHVVERQFFDLFLAEAAERAGADVHDQEEVHQISIGPQGATLDTTHDQYSARYVVAADGAHGVAARAMRLPRPLHGAAIEAEIPVDSVLADRYHDRVEIHVGSYPWGYAWVIPRQDVLNIGVGSFRPHSFPLKRRFFEFVEQIAGPTDVRPLAHPLPYRLRFVDPVAGPVLFAGDAAGYMDSFSAEGIYSALKSGELAAQAIVRAAQSGQSVSQYSTALYDEFWPSLKSAVKMGLLFYPLAGYWSDVFTQSQDLLSDYLEVAMGTLPYKDLRRHTELLLLKNPRLLSAHRQHRPTPDR